MKTIKKTIAIPIENFEFINTLMVKIKFIEIDRVATGGMMSSEKLLITYEGLETDYKEDYYIQVESKKEGYFYFYSLRILDGFYTNCFEEFKKLHNNTVLKYTCELLN